MTPNMKNAAFNTLLELQAELERRSSPQLLSLDVFGTLLTRTVGDPQSVFLLLGERLHAEGKIRQAGCEFAWARIAAERRAQKNRKPHSALTIEQIYAEFTWAWPDLGSRIESLIAAELEAESDAIRAFPHANQLIRLARAHSERIAFVCNTHLPKDFVRAQLIRHGLAVDEDAVYVTCDRAHGESIEDKLLRSILADQGIEGANSLHVGVDSKTDRDAAMCAGMRAVLLKDADLNRYERALEASAFQSGGLTSMLAGGSRLTRLAQGGDLNPDPMVRVLAGVAAPLLMGFTIWLLGRASALGLRRLYFLSREGEVLHELATVLNQRMQLGLDLRYLYVSRTSINRAMLTDPSQVNIDWALTNAGSHRLRGILHRLGLEPDEIRPELLQIGLGCERWDTRLNKSEYKALNEVLRSGPVGDRLSRKAGDAREVIESYLTENGFLDDENIGIVDTTGSGSQMRTLNLLRKKKTTGESTGFLLLRSWVSNLEEVGFPTIHTYLEDRKNKRGEKSTGGVIAMLEVFASVDYGSVVGYSKGVENIEPRFADVESERRGRWPLETIRKILRSFALELPLHPDLLSAHHDARPGIMASFSCFWNDPSPDEAAYWGAFPFEVGSGAETRYIELAPPLSLTEALRKAVGKRVPGQKWHTWASGREYRSSLVVRRLLQASRIFNGGVGKRHRTGCRKPVGRPGKSQ